MLVFLDWYLSLMLHIDIVATLWSLEGDSKISFHYLAPQMHQGGVIPLKEVPSDVFQEKYSVHPIRGGMQHP